MISKSKPKFMRIGYTQYSKLGLRRKNKQVYRKAKGGENKMRLKMKGHLRNVSIGYRSERKTRGLVKGFAPVIINSIDGLKNLKKNEIGIVAKLGKKRKIEIAEYAGKNNIRLFNLNPKKFLANIEDEKKKIKDEKINKETRKKERDKKAKEAVQKKEEEKDLKKQESEKLEDAVKNTETEIKENVEEIKSN